MNSGTLSLHVSGEVQHVEPLDRTRFLLEAPVLPMLLTLAAPTVALMTFQAVVNAAEGYFIGFLGADSLAGISLSFPLVMLMTTLSAGAYGGGIASAIARSLGAGDRIQPAQIAGTALSLGALLGIATSAAMLAFGQSIYLLLGATGPALESAVTYSNILFLGAVPFWVFQAAASCLRGSGNTGYPALVGAVGGVATLAISPTLIFGFGPIPAQGLAGAAWALVGYHMVSAVLLVLALAAPASPFRTAFKQLLPNPSLAAMILKVAVPSAFNSIQANVTFVVLTSLVAPFGTATIAGYGMAGRLEFLLIPIVFGIGSALVPVIGANAGAGHVDRVRQATRYGMMLGATAGAAVGITAAIVPSAWMGLFTVDPQVLTAGESYLRTVGPAYIGFGGGLALFFAAQGMGRVVPSLAAGFTRLFVAVTGGFATLHFTGRNLDSLYIVMSVGLVLYGLVMLIVVRKELGITRKSNQAYSGKASFSVDTESL